METYLPITYLNDFIFCPYSLYLHQVFENSSENVFSAKPQQKGKLAHANIDSFEKEEKHVLKGAYVISSKLGVYGKIDKFYVRDGKLVESKFQITTVYKGYVYQLWAQYFGLVEMGYEVKSISLYSIKDKKHFPIPIPGDAERKELREHIIRIAHFDFEAPLQVNVNKCKHCIYASLCDKTPLDHVYA